MAIIRKGGGGYGQQAGSTGGGAYAPTPKGYRRSRRTETYGAPAAATYGASAATPYYGSGETRHRRFPWAILAILCILAILFVIGLCKYGIKDTVPVAYPKPVYVTTTTVPAPPVVYKPLIRNG